MAFMIQKRAAEDKPWEAIMGRNDGDLEETKERIKELNDIAGYERYRINPATITEGALS